MRFDPGLVHAVVTQAQAAENAPTEHTGSFWMPVAASEHARSVDALFNFIYLGCTIFFIGVVVAMVYFAVKYKRREGDTRIIPRITHNTTLEIVWSVIPSILMLICFGWGFKSWMDLNVVPANALDVRITGYRWGWNFDYPVEGISPDDIVVPVGRDVKLTMSSKDVIHSFYIPAFRIKRDVLPNRYSVLWFNSDKEGEYTVFCAEYCGKDHSRMMRKVKVVSEAAYKEWVDSGGGQGGKDVPLSAIGEKVYKNKACISCHTLDGNRLVGPSFKGLYGAERKFSDGSTASADDNYIRSSITNPQAQIVEGYPGVMPAFKGILKDREIEGVIEYIKTLK